MVKECLWYDGVEGCYHLLDFDPNGLKDGQVSEKVKRQLQECFGLNEEDLEKGMQTAYLIDIENLERVKQHG